MRFGIAVLICLLSAPSGHRAVAQEAVIAPLEIGESGAAYERAIRYRGINAEVVYFDPLHPPPPLDTKVEPPKQTETSDGPGVSPPGTLITLAILLVVGFIFLRYGGGLTVSLGSEAGNAARARRRGPGGIGGDDELPQSLENIQRQPDRRLALIQLARAALARAVAANGVLLQRSWTARDALRYVAPDQSHTAALRDLVMLGERVHFGGQDVSEEDFATHLTRIRPLFAEAPA